MGSEVKKVYIPEFVVGFVAGVIAVFVVAFICITIEKKGNKK